MFGGEQIAGERGVFGWRNCGAFGDPDAGLGEVGASGDGEIVWLDEGAEWGGVGGGRWAIWGAIAEEKSGRFEGADTGLGIEIELADRLDFVIEKFDADGERMVEGKDIEDPPADGVLATSGDLGGHFVACFIEFEEERWAIEVGAFG